ncbi:MAG TPA: GNAT family N-acetyltransferase [Kofleriaceae bacterium]|nr:GNAT family N-acetyltransferase [Kofleriaceae bacterium]
MHRRDLARVETIYEQLAHETPPDEWLPVAQQSIDDTSGPPLAWVAVAPGDHVIGYIIGAIRSWEFGSAPAGWVIAIGVDLAHRQENAGKDLLQRLVASFAARGTRTVRTMVRRDDIRVLRFFRNAGFANGPYTELEMEVLT